MKTYTIPFIILTALCLLLPQNAKCQTEQTEVTDSLTTDSFAIQAVMDACIALRDAAASNDSIAIMEAATALGECNTADFRILRCIDSTEVKPGSGHLMFDETAAGEQTGTASQRERHRGQTADGSILTKTCFVKAGQSTKYRFSSKGHQELAVVAEAGGMVTMRIHVTNRDGLDQRYDDTRQVKTGMPHRKTSFDLPRDKYNSVELEIINCGSSDCSFVVISN
ncbi:MAG: hypothetical protein J5486_06080 [Bacteroidaceae bacterium]|nr:hypothetical protein [Bacteroidaceae bacterium]